MPIESPANYPGVLPLLEPGQASLDDLDRAIVACLQVNARATWQQVARVTGASESTVSRRANRLLRDRVVYVTVIPDPVRCGLGTPLLMQVDCAAGATTAVANTLARRSDVRFLALLTGSHDIVFEAITASREHLAEVVVDQLRSVPGVIRARAESVIRNFKTAYDWSRDILGDQVALLEPSSRPDTRPAVVDATDLQLIQLLATDGRTAVADLAEQLGLGEAATRRRLDALTATNAISFATLVDPPVMGFDVETFFWLDVEFSRLESTAEQLANHPEVRYVSATAGYSNLACEVILRDVDDLYRFNTEVLGSLQGIRRVEMGQEPRVFKRGYLLAPSVLSDDSTTVP